VVIAYRDMGCQYRRRSYAYVHGWYVGQAASWQLDLGWHTEVRVESGADDVSFTRASALNTAIRASVGRIIVQADPDNLVHPVALRKAIQLAAEHPGLVFPHDRYVRLGQAATDDYLNGKRLLTTMTPRDYEGPGGHGTGPRAVGGVVAFGRSTWEKAGGFDTRFGLWGGDDAAFAYAAAAFTTQHRRVSGDVTHLWHPRLPQSEIGSPGYLAQFAILAEYRDAAAISPADVRQLVMSRPEAGPDHV
jgi:N-terminal domain of galactosyltransferase